MGASSSSAVGALEDAPPPASEGLTSRSARLYAYDASSSKWTVSRALVEVDFVDDAAEGSAPDWHVEVRAALTQTLAAQLLRAATRALPPPAVRPLPAPAGCTHRRQMRRWAAGLRR